MVVPSGEVEVSALESESSVHSHDGYSSSGFARTGSVAEDFRKLSPRRGVPAGTEERGGAGVEEEGLEDLLVGGKPGVFFGDGERGVEKGWAAEVDVAGGGESGSLKAAEVERARVWVYVSERHVGRSF